MSSKLETSLANTIREKANEAITYYRRGYLCFRDAFNEIEELFHDVYSNDDNKDIVAAEIEQEEIARILLSRKRTFNNVKITFREV